METVKEILESLREWFKSRFTNPLFAAFIVAWLTMNWRVVLALFSDVSYREKIKWLDVSLYPEWWHWPAYGFVFPMFVAIVYVAISPPIFRFINTYYRTQQHRSAIALLKADAIEPVSPERAHRLLKEKVDAKLALRVLREQFNASEDDYIDQISKLRAAVESATAVPETGSAHAVAPSVEVNATGSDERLWRFTEADFIGGPERVEKLLVRGLSQAEANFLYAVRTHVVDEGFIPQDVGATLQGFDSFASQLTARNLKSLNLVRDGVPRQKGDDEQDTRYLISDEGMQAVHALIRRGFKPELQPSPVGVGTKLARATAQALLARDDTTSRSRPMRIEMLRDSGGLLAQKTAAQTLRESVGLLGDIPAQTLRESVGLLGDIPAQTLRESAGLLGGNPAQTLRESVGLLGDIPAQTLRESAGLLGGNPAQTLRESAGLLGGNPAQTLRESVGLLGGNPAQTLRESVGLLGGNPAQTAGLLGSLNTDPEMK